ncbi:MAG: hypothetical protein Q4P05_01690 [Actinomycetaceae bacterium]|nr:hypothetical protein [Actinomycetaceae bacterium]
MRRLTPREQALLDSVRISLAAQKKTHITDEVIDQACRLISAITSPRASMKDTIGPVCTTADLVEWMGISRQAINKAIKEARILAVRQGRGAWKYPVWQLTSDYQIVDGLSEVLPRMYGIIDSFDIAHWFMTVHRDLSDLTPAQWLCDQRDVSALIALAERFARRGQ